ncbi:dTDP-4-dehydrorhamnose reductase [Zeaxanthinibacter sp. PT1]|uniref:dTDP-4-dehydrorhamnose reductase n=1 Tax=Zeaxanthinibacter TaxID=561554 RepID=UPI00234BBD9F|nr:dTDP-4-dehydrorhamnose reductase [Zeaxanthinibacter sp. PT1]MDC6350616.1 dTDP-4-dehydrorhamnose reductase [Zeaxanthinibacter sp. PT1]
MKSVLVTGANGQLGQCLRAAAESWDDMVFDFRSQQELDITNKAAIDNLLEGNAYDYCINCAAYTNVEAAEKNSEKAFEINAEAVGIMARSCHEKSVVLIHISTDYVFDGEKAGPYLPSDPPNPINEYGKSKLKGEQYVEQYMSRYFIVRTSWLYSEYGDNFYIKILEKAHKGETLYITDAQTGTPTNANNLATYILDLIMTGSKEYGIHHFTDGKPMTWFDFAGQILKDNNLEEGTQLIRNNNYPTFAARPKNSVLQ